MNLYEKRWTAASTLVQKYKDLYDTGHYMVKGSDGDMFHVDHVQLVIDYDDREMYWEMVDTNSKTIIRYQIYEYDLEWDHGSYTKIADFKKWFTEEHKLFLYSPVEITV